MMYKTKATYQYNSSEVETQEWATIIYMTVFFYLRNSTQSKVARSSFPSPKVHNRIILGLCLFLTIPQIQYKHIHSDSFN